MKRLHPHSPSLPQALLLTQHGVLSGHSPVWAARPGAGRSEELPGFAEVAGIDLALVAGLGRQGGTHGVRGEGEFCRANREAIGWGLTWLTLLGLRQQELSRWLEVVPGNKHQLLELEELLYVLPWRGMDRKTA